MNVTDDSASPRTLCFGEASREVEFTRQGEYLDVVYRSPAVTANLTVYMATDWPALVGLFCFMSDHWRGWKRPKCFETVESDLGIECRHDDRSGVYIRIRMRSERARHDSDNHTWQLTAYTKVEAGQLERLAKAAQQTLLLSETVSGDN